MDDEGKTKERKDPSAKDAKYQKDVQKKPAFDLTDNEGKPVKAKGGEFVVQYDSKADHDATSTADEVADLGFINARVFAFPELEGKGEKEHKDKRAELEKQSGVSSVDFNYVGEVENAGVPNEPIALKGFQENTLGNTATGASATWEERDIDPYKGSGAYVAVLERRTTSTATTPTWTARSRTARASSCSIGTTATAPRGFAALPPCRPPTL